MMLLNWLIGTLLSLFVIHFITAMLFTFFVGEL